MRATITWWGENAGRFLSFYMVGRKRPILASVKLTYRCNLRCLHCPFVDKPELVSGPEFTFEALKSALMELRRRGSRFVVFEGGEPFVWRDGDYSLEDAVRYALGLFSCVGVTTNGTFPLNLPSDILWVSVDGLKGTHDSLRDGSFDRVMGNITRSSHPNLLAHVTISRANYGEMEEFLRTIDSIKRLKGITLQLYYPFRGEDELRLTREQRIDIVKTALRLKREGINILNSAKGLEVLRSNTWRCHDWLIDNLEPDGTFHQGCYVRTRGLVDCNNCGFTPHAEISLAFSLRIGAIRSGYRVFGPKHRVY